MLLKKIFDRAGLERMLAFWRFKGKQVSFSYGMFDSLKPGNIEMLTQAANRGDVLLVAVKSDDLVESLKGKGFLAHNQFNRAYMVASQMLVSGVFVVNKDELTEMVSMVKPSSITCCNMISSEELEALRKGIGAGGHVFQVDTSLTVEEPLPEAPKED